MTGYQRLKVPGAVLMICGIMRPQSLALPRPSAWRRCSSRVDAWRRTLSKPRRFQDLVPVRVWGFESPLSHQQLTLDSAQRETPGIRPRLAPVSHPALVGVLPGHRAAGHPTRPPGDHWLNRETWADLPRRAMRKPAAPIRLRLLTASLDTGSLLILAKFGRGCP